MLFVVGSSVKPFPMLSVSDADLMTTFTETLLPEFTVIAPRLTAEGVPALLVPKDKLVTAWDEALIDSITSAVTCPIAIVCPWLILTPEIPIVRMMAIIRESIVFMIHVFLIISRKQ